MNKNIAQRGFVVKSRNIPIWVTIMSDSTLMATNAMLARTGRRCNRVYSVGGSKSFGFAQGR
jgi:hypothetical protein